MIRELCRCSSFFNVNIALSFVPLGAAAAAEVATAAAAALLPRTALLPPLHRRSLLSEARGMTMQPPSVTSKFLPSPLVIGPLCRKVDINRARAGAPLSRLSLCMRHRNCIVTILNMHSPLSNIRPGRPAPRRYELFFASECTLEQRYRESEASAPAP